MRLLCRFLAVAAHHSEPPPRSSEALASLTLYPTTRRDVQATPTKCPGGAENTPGLTGGDDSDDPQRSA